MSIQCHSSGENRCYQVYHWRSRRNMSHNFWLGCLLKNDSSHFPSESTPSCWPDRQPLRDEYHWSSREHWCYTSVWVDIKLAFWSLQLLQTGTTQGQFRCHIQKYLLSTSHSCLYSWGCERFGILIRKEKIILTFKQQYWHVRETKVNWLLHISLLMSTQGTMSLLFCTMRAIHQAIWVTVVTQ